MLNLLLMSCSVPGSSYQSPHSCQREEPEQHLASSGGAQLLQLGAQLAPKVAQLLQGQRLHQSRNSPGQVLQLGHAYQVARKEAGPQTCALYCMRARGTQAAAWASMLCTLQASRGQVGACLVGMTVCWLGLFTPAPILASSLLHAMPADIS